MATAVIAVLKGGVFFLSDGLLLRDLGPVLAVLCPDIGAVINVPLLLEGGIFVQNLLVGVFVVICAQVIELPRRADADQLRCFGFGRQRSLGKMGVVVVGLARRAAYHQLCVKARLAIDLRHPIDPLHQRRRQGKQVVGLCLALVCDHNGDRIVFVQRIHCTAVRHGYSISRQVLLIDYAVAVALHRFVGQCLNVCAEEAVVGSAVPLVVHQCAVFKLRLPVAVMGQVFQLGIGVQRQAQTTHQVVGIGIAVLSGEGVRSVRSEQFLRVCGVQLMIVFLFADGRFCRSAEIVHILWGSTASPAAGIGCRSVCQAFSRQRRAGAVYIFQFIAGQVARYKARSSFAHQETGGITICDF